MDLDINLNKEKEINDYLESNKLWCGYISYNNANNSVSIEIIDGDWKHDHLRCDFLMRNLDYSKLDEVITEDDGSDVYSSVHYYEKEE